jgi:hypothetical protein
MSEWTSRIGCACSLLFKQSSRQSLGDCLLSLFNQFLGSRSNRQPTRHSTSVLNDSDRDVVKIRIRGDGLWDNEWQSYSPRVNRPSRSTLWAVGYRNSRDPRTANLGGDRFPARRTVSVPSNLQDPPPGNLDAFARRSDDEPTACRGILNFEKPCALNYEVSNLLRRGRSGGNRHRG